MKSHYYFVNTDQQNSTTPFNIVVTNTVEYTLKRIFFAFLFLCITYWNASATTYSWNGGNGDYTIVTNWTPNGTPGAADALNFTSAATIINVPNGSVTSITVQSSGAVILQGAVAGNVLTLSNAVGALVINALGALTIGSNIGIALSGTSSNAGTLTVASGGLINFTGAGQSDPGNITVNGGGEMKFSGSGTPVLAAPAISGGTLTIAGTVTSPSGTTPVYTNGTLQYIMSNVNITTGAELPPSLANLVIANSGSNNQVILSSSLTITGTVMGLNITNGIFKLNSKILTLMGLAKGVINNGRILVDAAATINFNVNTPGTNDSLYFVGASLGTLNMNCTGVGITLAVGGILKISNTLTLSNGIINVVDGTVLTYTGTAANLAAGSSTSYISYLSPILTHFGFGLGDGIASIPAATYLLPLGTTTTTGSPAVNGYRPVQITWSTTAVQFFKIGYLNDAGISSSPGDSVDIPLAGNNRTGVIATISTNVASYGLSMTYINSDFTSPPVIGNVNIYYWTGRGWTASCQSSSAAGTPNFIYQNSFTVMSGTLALAEIGGNVAPAAAYYWTGTVSNVWEDYRNWTGDGSCGLYPGKASYHDTVYITALSPSHQPTLSSFIQVQMDTLSNGNILTLTSGAYLRIWDRVSPLSLSGGATVNADILSTIEYADGSYYAPTDYTYITTGFTYGNLIISNLGKPTQNNVYKRITNSVTIANSLTVWGGVTLFIDAGTTTVNGSILLVNNLYWVYNGSTFSFDSEYVGGIITNSAAPLVMTGTYGTPTLNGSGVDYRLSSSIGYLNVKGNITVTGGSTMDSLNISNGAVISINTNDTLKVNRALRFTNGMINAIPANSVVEIGSFGGVAGVSQSNGWVNGSVQKDGNTNFTFPVGDGIMYRPMGISSLIGSDSYTAEYFHTNPNSSGYDVTLMDPSLTNVSHCEYWMLNDTGSQSQSANVTLSWDNTYSCGVSVPADLRVAEWNGAKWKDQGNTSYSLVNQTLTSGVISSFNDPFTLSSVNASENPLPITLLNFAASPDNNVVKLDWSTSSEVNNNYFTVEKTKNLVDFIAVDTIKGAGNSTSLRNYHTLDEAPFAGVSFYRLKQEDYNGKFSYSLLQAINFDKSASGIITLFPNPVSDKVYLSVSNPGSVYYTAHIFDMKGSEVMAPVSIAFKEGALVSIDLHSLAAGIYTLSLISDTGIQQERITKQ